MDRPAPAIQVESDDGPPAVEVRSHQVSRPLEHLTPQERAVYLALAAQRGRVVSRAELARVAGLTDLSERRCDALLVGVRRALGADAVRTVRRRGWMLVA